MYAKCASYKIYNFYYFLNEMSIYFFIVNIIL